MIERAYLEAEAAGLALWCQDEAGPYQAIPQPGASWEFEGQPVCQPHEYERGGTAKLLTLFHPATGQVRAKGVVSATNAVLHPWLKEQVLQILATLPPLPPGDRGPLCSWDTWFGTHVIVPLPPLRMLLLWDNLAGHKNWRLCQWLVEHGIMPLFTPLGGSWLNMAESVQRILERRALAGQHPKDAAQVIQWLEETVEGWNAHPTPFVWGGKRQQRRQRARRRRLAGSGAAIPNGYPIPA